MRVVLDTNILISACLKPDGLEAQTVQLARDRAFTLCVSEAVWREYVDVLSRPKFDALRLASSEMLAALHGCAEIVEPIGTLDVASDEDDNRLLECADAARATYLVTGNRKHFPEVWGSTKVVNAREFLVSAFQMAPA